MYLKNPTKKIITFACVIFFIGVLITTILSLEIFFNKKRTNIQEYYPRLVDENNVFIEVDASEALKLFKNKETFFMIFAFPSCPWCQQLIPELNIDAKRARVGRIYYLDIKEMRDNVDSADHEAYLKLEEYCAKALDKSKNRINAPTIVAVQEGCVIDYHLDTVSSHQMENGILPEMTAEQRSELRSSILHLFSRLQ